MLPSPIGLTQNSQVMVNIMSERVKGTVKWFNESKGFGFIIDTEDQEKYFCHVSGLLDEITENDKVQFELEKGMKGLNAVRVKKI